MPCSVHGDPLSPVDFVPAKRKEVAAGPHRRPGGIELGYEHIEPPAWVPCAGLPGRIGVTGCIDCNAGCTTLVRVQQIRRVDHLATGAQFGDEPRDIAAWPRWRAGKIRR